MFDQPTIPDMKFVSLPAVPDIVPPPQLLDPGFEMPNVGNGYMTKPGADSPWVWGGKTCGVAGNGSAMTSGNPPAPDGTQVAFLQGDNMNCSQSVIFAAGNFTISFMAAQQAGSNQTIQAQADANVVGSFTPPDTNYSSYTTPPFPMFAGLRAVMLKSTSTGTVLIDSVSISNAP